MLRILSVTNILAGSYVIITFLKVFYEDARVGWSIMHGDLIMFLIFILPAIAPIWFSAFTIKYVSHNEPILEQGVLDAPMTNTIKKKKKISFFTTLCGIITFLDALFLIGTTIYLIISISDFSLHSKQFLAERFAVFSLLLFVSFSMIYYPIKMIRKVTYE